MDPKKPKKLKKSSLTHPKTDKALKKPKILKTPTPNPPSSDDSEDEEILIRTGRVPRKWYSDYKHLGYDSQANTVLKKEQENKLDEIIRRSEDPNWWRLVRDELNNKEIVLSDPQLDLLHRIRNSKFADPKISQTDVTLYNL